MHHVWIQLVPLLVMLCIAAAIDLRSRRIPNWLCGSILLTGLLQSFIVGHPVTPASSFLGILAGFGPPFLLFILGAVGGADVKLLAAIGAWVGPVPVLLVFLIETIVGMVIVIFQAAYYGRLKTLFRNSAMIAMNIGHVQQLGVEHVKTTGQACTSFEKKTRLPYAIPVLISTVIVIVTMLATR